MRTMTVSWSGGKASVEGEVTVDAMTSYFYDIMDEQALPLLQVGVWIPKAKMGPEADHFQPL